MESYIFSKDHADLFAMNISLNDAKRQLQHKRLDNTGREDTDLHCIFRSSSNNEISTLFQENFDVVIEITKTYLPV